MLPHFFLLFSPLCFVLHNAQVRQDPAVTVAPGGIPGPPSGQRPLVVGLPAELQGEPG